MVKALQISSKCPRLEYLSWHSPRQYIYYTHSGYITYTFVSFFFFSISLIEITRTTIIIAAVYKYSRLDENEVLINSISVGQIERFAGLAGHSFHFYADLLRLLSFWCVFTKSFACVEKRLFISFDSRWVEVLKQVLVYVSCPLAECVIKINPQLVRGGGGVSKKNMQHPPLRISFDYIEERFLKWETRVYCMIRCDGREKRRILVA